MTFTITKFTEKASKFGGTYTRVEFISIDNKSYYTCLDPRKKNYIRWKRILKIGIMLKGLNIKEGKLINADSNFEVIGE